MNHDEPIALCENCGELVWWDDTELVWGCGCISTIERPDEDGLPEITDLDWPPQWRPIEDDGDDDY